MIHGDSLKNKNILFIGGSGKLGSRIIKNKFFKDIQFPSSKKLNILNKKKICDYLTNNKITHIIHAAAISNMKLCEENVSEAIKVNIEGTFNIIECAKKINKEIKFIYISSDGVYSKNKGNNKEVDNLHPYNTYCWTKLCSEFIVKTMENYIIIRTRFFDKDKLFFEYYADDIITSSIEIKDFMIYLIKILNSDFKGVINIGSTSESNFKKFSKIKKNIKKCKFLDIQKNINYTIASNSTMNLDKLNKLFN